MDLANQKIKKLVLVILSKYDYLEGIKFYSSIPDFAKNNDITAHFYTMLLIQKGDFIQAKELLENLYFNKKYELIKTKA